MVKASSKSRQCPFIAGSAFHGNFLLLFIMASGTGRILMSLTGKRMAGEGFPVLARSLGAGMSKAASRQLPVEEISSLPDVPKLKDLNAWPQDF